MSILQLLAPENQQPVLVAAPRTGEVLSGGSCLGNSELQIALTAATNSREHALQWALRENVSSRYLEGAEATRELVGFDGEWVVLQGTEVVSHGFDPVRVVADARGRGILAPYIFRVQHRESGTITFGL